MVSLQYIGIEGIEVLGGLGHFRCFHGPPLLPPLPPLLPPLLPLGPPLRGLPRGRPCSCSHHVAGGEVFSTCP